MFQFLNFLGLLWSEWPCTIGLKTNKFKNRIILSCSQLSHSATQGKQTSGQPYHALLIFLHVNMKVEVGGNDTCSLKSPVSYILYPELPDIRELNYLFPEVFSTQRFFHGFNFITNSFMVWAWLSLIFQILIGIQWNIDSGSNINPVRIPDILEKIVYLCFLERIIKDRGWENWRHFTAPLSFLN